MKESPDEKKKSTVRLVGGTDVSKPKPEERKKDPQPTAPEKEKRDYAAELEALGILKRGGNERAKGVPPDTRHSEDSENGPEKEE